MKCKSFLEGKGDGIPSLVGSERLIITRDALHWQLTAMQKFSA